MDDNIKKLLKLTKNIQELYTNTLDNVLLLPFGKLPLNIFEENI